MAQTKWVAGWPVASWFGFAGAIAAWLAALLDHAESGTIPWRTVGVGFACLVLALLARKKAEEI